MNSLPHIKRRLDRVLACAFVVMLSMPAIYWLCGFNKIKFIDEYRVFAEFPGFNSDATLLQLFGKDLEKYYDDHFGGRELLIACHLKIERFLFPEMTGGIIIGRDGWLYSQGQNMVDEFVGASKLTLRQLKSRKVELEDRRNELAARGIKYLFVISPNKESVYPEYLPDWLQQCSTATKTDQFVDYMRLHSTVEMLDLRPVLQKAREPAPAFYKTDDHWNLMGASIACEAIISKLSSPFPGLAPAYPTDAALMRTNGTGGDTARFAGMLTLIDDNFYAFRPGTQMLTQKYYSPTNQINPLQFETLPITEYTFMTTTNSRQTGCAVIFGDSYTFELAPFLGRHFGKVCVIRKKFNFEDIDKIKPDFVIDEKVERWLHASFHRG